MKFKQQNLAGLYKFYMKFVLCVVFVLSLVCGANCETLFKTEGNSSSKSITSLTLDNKNDIASNEPVPVYTFKIINSFPHDPDAFTQGLVFEDGVLYESTGLNGSSTLRKVELETGNVINIKTLPFRFFGEGIAILNDRIIQLTLKSHLGFVFDKDSFNLTGTVRYITEGWGLTHDGTRLIMSDGTSVLYFRDPESFRVLLKIDVRDNNGSVVNLNELEYINGEIFANVWQTDRIVRIDPETGRVIGWIDLEGLLDEDGEHTEPVNVLNGIAYDEEDDRLFVTGKLWPKLFEIELELQ